MRSLLITLAFAATAACSASDVSQDTSDLSNPNYGYFVARPDLRKCASPMCGGYFVHRVNTAKTLCASGGYADECYVTSVDLSSTGLTSDEQAATDVSGAVLRGKITKTKINGSQYGVFDASEAWVAQTRSTATGAVYRATDNGIKCIKAPCPTITVVKLDTTSTKNVSGLDLAQTDVAAAQETIDAAVGDLETTSGLVVSGTIVPQKDGGNTLVATEFYRRAVSSVHLCGSKGTTPCASGEYCAYDAKAQCGAADAPGVCTARPQICYQLYKPVCGCDGKTYTNECFAGTGGTSVAHDGACN